VSDISPAFAPVLLIEKAVIKTLLKGLVIFAELVYNIGIYKIKTQLCKGGGMLKKILFSIAGFLFTFSGLSFAADGESITISTYYPAPYGVYQKIRLYPTSVPTTSVDRGLMYYNTTDNLLKYHNDTEWVNLTGTSCVIKQFDASGGADLCPAGYQTWSAKASGSTGDMLCCKVERVIPPS